MPTIQAMRMFLLKILESIFFPKFCLGCGKWGDYVCASCWKKIRAIEVSVCPYCSKRTLDGYTHPLCGNLAVRVDGLFSVFYYQGTIAKLLSSLKYQSATVMALSIESILQKSDLSKLRRYLGENAVLVSVPLHRTRLLQRGFNQSQLLANIFARLLSLEVEHLLLKRVKNTPPQAKSKSKTERLMSMKDAFAVSKTLITSLKQKTLVLVDDVYTTGSTTKEITRALKGAGCERVLVLTLCH